MKTETARTDAVSVERSEEGADSSISRFAETDPGGTILHDPFAVPVIDKLGEYFLIGSVFGD